MPKRRISLVTDRQTNANAAVEHAHLSRVFDAVRAELKVPDDFPPEVLAEAREAAGASALPARDETGLPFLTIDPPGSMDLDQALHIERAGEGYRVRYAIADESVFVLCEHVCGGLAQRAAQLDEILTGGAA